MNTNTTIERFLPRARRLVAACVLAAGALASWSPAQSSDGEWVVHPKQVGASIDFGQIQNGYVANELENFAITRTGVYMNASGTYDDRLDARVGLGGLFWFVAAKESDPVRRLIRFGGGIGEAQAIYYFGGKSEPSSWLQAGFFPVKYSPSHNLGEYLYRSGTYPGTLHTGGWSYMNASAYMAQGLRYTLPTFGGLLTHDFTLFMERDYEPLNDFSPGYNLTARPLPYLELGAGVVWAHGLSVRPSRLAPKTKVNAYSKTTNMPVFGADLATPAYDSAGNFVGYDTLAREAQTLQDWEDCQAGDCSDIGYYTFRGFKAAAGAVFDVGALVAPQVIPASTFRVYGEVALLGIEDQPFYYEKKSERMPLMLGIDIPTFGILDRLSAEVEYNKSRFRNTIYSVNQDQNPIPLTKDDISGGSGLGGYAYLGDEGDTKDDFRWSFFASRRITEGLSIHAQAASDHMRHPDFWGVMSDESATRSRSEWYYVLRMDFGF